MSKWSMRGHFRYLCFKTFTLTPRTPQCEVFWTLLLSSEHSGVPEDSKSPTFASVGLHPHTWPKWGCDTCTQSALLLFLLNFGRRGRGGGKDFFSFFLVPNVFPNIILQCVLSHFHLLRPLNPTPTPSFFFK
jgi:hypothetical protein